MLRFLKQNFFIGVIAILFLLYVSAGFVRFFILHDYYVSFSVPCDPDTESCYFTEECEDEICNDVPFKIVEMYAQDVYELCDEELVTGCTVVQSCTNNSERYCEESLCDPESEKCTL